MTSRIVIQGGGQADGPPELVIVGDRVFSSGLVSDRPGGLESETHRIFQLTLSMLRDAGIAPGDVVRTRAWYVEDEPGAGAEVILDTHGVVFDHPGPAFSAVRVPALPGGAEVAIELQAIKGAADRIKHFGSDEVNSTSIATFCDGEIWIGGITSAEPGLEAQITAITRQSEDALAEFGMSPADVVSTRHFLLPDSQFSTPPAPWAEFMSIAVPTSAGIAVDGVGEAGERFMLECDAVQDASNGRNNLRSGRTYEVDHHYCRSVRVNGREVVYVAGTTSTAIGEVVRSEFDVAGQVRDTLETVRWSIEEQEATWADLVHVRAYVVGGSEAIAAASMALEELLAHDVAVTIVAVPTLARPEVVVEIEATAVSGAI